MIESYEKFLNIKLFEDVIFEDVSNEEMIKNIGLSNFEKIESVNENREELLEMYHFITMNENLNQSLVTEIFAGVMSKLISYVKIDGKQVIEKGSVFWYMLTYGIVEAIKSMGEDILNKKKKVEFCEAFSKGVGVSVTYWASDKVIGKILGFLGLDISLSMVTRIVAHNATNQIFDKNWLVEASNEFFCGVDNFELTDERGRIKKASFFEAIFDTLVAAKNSLFKFF